MCHSSYSTSMSFDCFKMHQKCKAGCCSSFPLEKELWEAKQSKIMNKPKETHELGKRKCPFTREDKSYVLPVTEDGYCSFLDKSNYKCNIYEDRPEVCKRFGDESHSWFSCPYQDKNGKERSRQQTRKQLRDAKKLLKILN